MTAKDHNKLIGILFLVQAGLGLLGLIFAIVTFGLTGLAVVSSARRGEEAAAGIAIFGGLIFVLILVSVFLIPSLLAGLGMLKGRRWARIWAIIAACLALLSFPLGTAIGIYALWFLFGEMGKSYYSGATGTGFNAPPPNSWR